MMEDAIEDAGGGNAEVEMGGELPDDWPSDVPVYADATMQYSASVDPSTGQPGAMAVLMTDDRAEDVAGFYRDSLADEGWTITASMESGGTTVIGATKDTRVLSLSFASSEGQTTITIGVGAQ
jgi:hypothetical protein